ncbi:hypothetical protein BHE74_00019986 [Ensete ventricosum]|nr:hypothetical protein BHE74_00019986 [Ensete ventricosum]
MARRGSLSGRWRYLHPGYYMKRPARFAAVFTALILATTVVWDRRSLLRDYEVGADPFISTWVSSLTLVPSAEVSRLYDELNELQHQLREVEGHLGDGNEIFSGTKEEMAKNNNVWQAEIDPVNSQRREKVKEAMLHAWNSYVKYAWGQDELQVRPEIIYNIFYFYIQPQSMDGVNSFGGLGATVVDSLDTLYIMDLEDEFQKARE